MREIVEFVRQALKDAGGQKFSDADLAERAATLTSEVTAEIAAESSAEAAAEAASEAAAEAIMEAGRTGKR